MKIGLLSLINHETLSLPIDISAAKCSQVFCIGVSYHYNLIAK